MTGAEATVAPPSQGELLGVSADADRLSAPELRRHGCQVLGARGGEVVVDHLRGLPWRRQRTLEPRGPRDAFTTDAPVPERSRPLPAARTPGYPGLDRVRSAAHRMRTAPVDFLGSQCVPAQGRCDMFICRWGRPARGFTDGPVFPLGGSPRCRWGRSP